MKAMRRTERAMGVTMVEKILAKASGRTAVKAGRYVTATIDKL